MRTLLLLLVVLLSLDSSAQKTVHIDLKRQLDTILKTDQGIREFVDTEVKPARKDTLAMLLNYPRGILDKSPWLIMRKIDSLNIHKVEQIIAKYGYPGKTMVGEPENTAVFYVIQHSNKIQKYYPLIEKAGKSGELPFKYTAMMLDRNLVVKARNNFTEHRYSCKPSKILRLEEMRPLNMLCQSKIPKM